MPALPLTGQDLIEGFEQYVDDTTELSSTQELALANKIYFQILSNRPWFFLIKASGNLAISNDGTNYYVTLPADFDYIPITSGQTDTGTYGQDKTIFTVDSNGNSYPYKVINFTDRRSYYKQDGYAYIDKLNNKLVFTGTPVQTLCSFDYIYSPDSLTLNTSPVFPAQFHDMIYHGMAVTDMIIQMFDKARSYGNENKAEYESMLDDMASWNSQYFSQ